MHSREGLLQILEFYCICPSFTSDQSPCPCWYKDQQHDAATKHHHIIHVISSTIKAWLMECCWDGFQLCWREIWVPGYFSELLSHWVTVSQTNIPVGSNFFHGKRFYTSDLNCASPQNGFAELYRDFMCCWCFCPDHAVWIVGHKLYTQSQKTLKQTGRTWPQFTTSNGVNT